MDFTPHIANLRKRFAELEQELSRPDLYANPAKAQQITREHSRLKTTLATCSA